MPLEPRSKPTSAIVGNRDAVNFDRLVARLNGLTPDCRQPAAEEIAQHVRRDAVCKQERPRNSALAAGKQLKRPAPLRNEMTSPKGIRHCAPLHRLP
jgi:hypothetical protein